MKLFKPAWKLMLLCGMFVLFFVMLFYCDNQYQLPPPYGKDGLIKIMENDLGDTPLFLIDGWMLTDSRTAKLPTYIGEYSNLQRGNSSVSPHGSASYQITLRFNGNPTIVAIRFPRLSTDYSIFLDDRTIAHGYGDAQAVFTLKPGDQTLTVQTSSLSGYYSGMYFPPVLGIPRILSQMQNIQILAYALALLVPLVLALFTLTLWWRRNDPRTFWFGILCCFYAFYVTHYFVYLFHLPLIRCWNFAEGGALYGLVFCVVRLTALVSDMAQDKIYRAIQYSLVALSLMLLAFYLFIPVFPQAVALHGMGKDFYLIFTFCSLSFLAIHAALHRCFEYRYILAGCMLFGFGLLLNLLFSNRFEPILFLWQFEWCGLFLVLLFGRMMTARNRRILAENAELSHHLEQLVEKRTEELSTLLSERKAFFADIAHDLKAPLFATQSFIRAIRQNGTGVDGELVEYLNAAEQKQQQMARRLQSLSIINHLDRITEGKELISIHVLLDELYRAHHAEAEVSSIHLLVRPPATDCQIFAQPEKLDILFENLIYNAIRATPVEGRIVISATLIGERVCISISDSGCGIPQTELPHIFDRFYVGEYNKEMGTGLGLYIVKSIVTEMSGEISVSSQLGVGTEFLILLDLVSPQNKDHKKRSTISQ
ncbi:MAG: HAMP domain-containing sensor histidine kinase [Oscillospiraceae bacterium]